MLGVAIDYKEADININLDTTNSLYDVTMGIRSCFNSRKDDTDHHLVIDAALEGGSAVLYEANIPGVATEHGEIGARDDEKAAVCNGLDHDVQKRGGGASSAVQLYGSTSTASKLLSLARARVMTSVPASQFCWTSASASIPFCRTLRRVLWTSLGSRSLARM